ncbi:MAG: ABC transporter permease [Marinifilaceae bacterium]
MLKNYLIVAFRNLLRQKSYSLINILGLSTGLAATLMLLIYIYHEISYDRMHEKGELIYRVISEADQAEGKTLKVAMTMGNLAPLISENIPEMASVCRVEDKGNHTIWNENIKFEIPKLLQVDSCFFDIFSFEVLQGDRPNLFRSPHSLVLSETMAKKIFKNESPIGKVLKMNNADYTVTGTFRDVPATSHIQFDAIRSNNHIKNLIKHYNYRGCSIPIYFLFKEGSNSKVGRDKVTKYINDYIDEKFGNTGINIRSSVQNLWDIHLGENLAYDFSPAGKMSTILIFGVLALFILLIAVINFINLFIAKSEKRVKEVGIRKTLGALPRDLQKQFWGESTLLTLISLGLAFGFLELALDKFAELTNRELNLELFAQPFSWLILAAITLVIIFISGSYPVFYLSQFDPAVILKGAGQTGKKKNQLKTFLVFFQFAIAIFLITNIIVLDSQVSYMENKELGFNKEEMVIVKDINYKIAKNYENLKDRFLRNPNILSVTASESYPGNQATLQNCYPEGGNREEAFMIYENRVRRSFMETYQMQIVQGRDFNPEMKSDTASFVINETAAQKLGFENPIGERIIIWEQPGEIIGVVKDFNFLSLYDKVEPIIFSNYYNPISMTDYISLRINMQNSKEVIHFIKEELEQLDPNYTFRYEFLNDALNNQYKEENQTMKLIMAASGIAIILSILGLFALTSYIVVQRTKEIGIRKTLGASEIKIVRSLGGAIVKWVLLANLLAWPLSYLIMEEWLQHFAYRIAMTPAMFIGAGTIGFIIAGITIAWKIINAARENPVVALKYE